MSPPIKPPSNSTAIVVAVCVVFCFTLATVAAIFIAAPDGANTGSLITSLLGTLAPTIAALALLVKVNSTEAKVDRVEATTDRLANGLLDAKIRAGVADVLDPSLIDETAHQQLATDRHHRSKGTSPDDIFHAGGQ